MKTETVLENLNSVTDRNMMKAQFHIGLTESKTGKLTHCHICAEPIFVSDLNSRKTLLCLRCAETLLNAQPAGDCLIDNAQRRVLAKKIARGA